VAVSAHKNEFWINELVFDFKKGHVWHTRVRLSINSFKRYSSLTSILSGYCCPPGVAAGLIGTVPNMSVGAKKWEKKSSSSSHCLHCSFSGKIDIKTESTLRWNTK